jgi:2-dehydropantoate 2-reductase
MWRSTMSDDTASVVVYGPGAIGATAGGWLAEAGVPVTFVARPETARLLNEQGLRLYAHGRKAEERTVRVAAVSDVSEAPRPDMVVLAVKNYDLDAAARDLRAKVQGNPIVIALQNGIENQSILPKHFACVVYGVVRYNAWRDAANEFGYEKKGPILVGVTDPALVADRDRVVRLLSTAFDCSAEDRISDAARCKMLFNLMNSITALVGFGLREIEDYGAFSDSVALVLYEGMQILRKAGVHEVRFDRGGTWRNITAAKFLPGFITSRILRKNMRDVHITSMAQDVYLAKRGVTELESLNGYFVRLAESIGFDARYNKALYRITSDWLAQPEIRPIHERELRTMLRAA